MSRESRNEKRCVDCKRKRVLFTDGRCARCVNARLARQGEGQELRQRSGIVLTTQLLDMDKIADMFARGVNHQVLYQSATAIVESVMDPASGLEVNRLTCVGDTWPVPPLRVVLDGEDAK